MKEFLKKFKDLGIVGIGNITASLISGIFWFYFASLLGAEQYGEVSYYISIAVIASTLSFLGLGNAIIVYTAKGEKIQPPIFLVGIISSIITLIAVFLIFSQIGMSLYIVGYVIFSLATSEILGKKQYKNYSSYLVTQKILMVGFSLFFYYYMGLEGVILGIALSFFPYIKRIYSSMKNDKIDFSLVRPRIGFIINSYALDLSRTFSGYTDKLIVAPLFGFAILGNYQLGIQVLAVLTILPGIVYQYILPRDSSGDSNKKLKKLTITISIILAGLGFILAPIVLPILFPKFIESIEVIQIVSISVIPSTINLMYISKFLGNELSKIVLIGSGIFLSVQIVSIFLLGELFGVNGVAAALVLGSSAEAIFLISVNKFVYKLDE
jgi:O-antigen/teichoic acid export membrane protein